MKTLQILVNHYNEDVIIVKRFLDSLNKQIGVNFEVLICSDGNENIIPREALLNYSFPIKYTHVEHKGFCYVRNILLNAATSDYIMFCDIDDAFNKPEGLKLLLEKAEETGADIIGSQYQAEILVKDNIFYQTLEKDALRVHSKIFKRKYLIENNIYFPDVKDCGDQSFLFLAYGLTDKFIWMDNNFYIWKWNENSITRKSDFYSIESYEDLIKSYMWLADILLKRNKIDLLAHLFASLISMMYADTKKDQFNKAPKECVDKANEAINNCLQKIWNLYKSLPEDFRKQYITNENDFENIINWGDARVIIPNNIVLVGHNEATRHFAQEISSLNPVICEKIEQDNNKYSIAFIMLESLADISAAIEKINANIYVIKSLILPGTIDNLCESTKKSIVYCYNDTILGGKKEDCLKVQEKLQEIYNTAFHITDAKTVEFMSYIKSSV